MDEPSVVGVPVIAPVFTFRLKPAGRLPFVIDQVIGVVPVAAKFWLYAFPTSPPGKETVVITGGAAITIFRGFVILPVVFVALTVKLDVPIVVGVPVIAPDVSFKLKPAGRLPLAIDQVIGVVPVAVNLWL